ncbi:hypothetical protein MJT46_001830 [Ovis ammon polii x Ovis aries]|nr:hypothetical protein MJT46_001830 [Ovis ammon polii x Ovis aries]
MAQSASEAGGLAWGWDGDVDEDWEGAALTLLSLAVVAATALALHWFGSAQDQEVPGPALWPSQVGAAGPALPPKHKETYAWMSDNLLHVLREPNLYRQLSGADRERIVSLRTGRGPAVLGALVLPGLYGG